MNRKKKGVFSEAPRLISPISFRYRDLHKIKAIRKIYPCLSYYWVVPGSPGNRIYLVKSVLEGGIGGFCNLPCDTGGVFSANCKSQVSHRSEVFPVEKKKSNGRYLVIVILLLAFFFALALRLSVKSVINQMKDSGGKDEAAGTSSPGDP